LTDFIIKRDQSIHIIGKKFRSMKYEIKDWHIMKF
jgi:hypothetical protein